LETAEMTLLNVLMCRDEMVSHDVILCAFKSVQMFRFHLTLDVLKTNPNPRHSSHHGMHACMRDSMICASGCVL
jgi:hypothetical protein